MVATSASYTGSIPEYYDRCLGPAWFDAFAEDLGRRIPPDPGDVLEIACGTGLVTRRLRARLHPGRRLVASDVSAAMLAYARDALGPGAGIEWREADATKLPFGDGEFGATVCAFGVMFVPDKPAAFREARRVLARGGRFLFNVWDRIEANPCAAANAEVLEGLFPGDPEMRFRVPYEMHDPSVLRGLLEDAGFEMLSIEPQRVQIDGVSARTVATGQIRGSPRSLLIEKRGIPLEQVIALVERKLAGMGGADPLRAPANAIVVEAAAV